MSDDQVDQRKAKLVALREQGVAYPNDFARDEHNPCVFLFYVTVLDNELESSLRSFGGMEVAHVT